MTVLGILGGSGVYEIAGLKDAVLVSTPSGKGKEGSGRTVRCFTLLGRMDPATGSISSMDFQGGVDIVEPKRHATAHDGHYEEAGQVLSLAADARVLSFAASHNFCNSRKRAAESPRFRAWRTVSGFSSNTT